MTVEIIFLGLFIASFLFAWYSMKDFHPKKKHSNHSGNHEKLPTKSKQGRILILKDKSVHYSSESSSSDPV